MKDVKLYRFVDGNGYPALPIVDGVSAEKFVEVSDFDAALSKLAAETLRADTAEADYRELSAENDSLLFRASAAEQRVSELEQLLFYAYERLSKVRFLGLRKRIDAALNPKPEAGSQ